MYEDLNHYEPTGQDISWTKNLIRTLKEGGRVCYPSTRLIYEVLHSKKQFILLNPIETEYDLDSAVTHFRTKMVLRAIGWDCSEKGLDNV